MQNAGFNTVVLSLLDLLAPCCDVSSAFLLRVPHAPLARIHVAVHQYASKNFVAAKYSGITPKSPISDAAHPVS